MNKFNININRVKRQLLSNIVVVRWILLVFVVLLLFIGGFFAAKAIKNGPIGVYISSVKEFLLPDLGKVIVNDDRINLLILGKGEIDHDSSELTDTMILASISTNNKQINMISIPRDIWVEEYRDKINAAYLIGNEKQPNGGGLTLAKSTVEEILGVQIPYAVVIDFNGFKEVIDGIGGVEVDVKGGFIDKEYPVKGKENDECMACRYTTVAFEKGLQLMDGERALVFVRSRHGDNNEGNDIARQARQQLLITSVFKKLTNPKTFLNIDTDRKLIKILEENIISDLHAKELAIVARQVFEARNSIKANTIPEDLLLNPPNQYLYFNDKYDHAFVFVPNNKDRSWQDVHSFVKSLLN